ncbi:MAG TPA: DNA-binding protein, partial [Myxococcaceae bacterium]|nr:DNA-binding protein [Myxococcaceae bacterium]
AGERPPFDRLDSWKEIAAYLRRDVTTVQRWEKREAMPVHRHQHDRIGSVYAYRHQLDAWARTRRLGGVPADREAETALPGGPTPGDAPPARRGSAPRRWGRWTLLAVGGALLAAGGVWSVRGHPRERASLLAEAHYQQLTDFEGIQQAAVLSRDGRFVAFQSDHDGQMDVWVTQIGTGRFSKLNRGSALEIVNPSVRTLGFSPDGSQVTFWARGRAGSDRPEIGIWGAPLLGGPPRVYLEGAAEFDWSGDGEWLAYHTPGPGDPMFVRAAAPGSEARAIFTAPPGLHSHFLVWSPDQAFIYFVQGALPDRMDLWRIAPNGGTPERVTRHEAQVSHPIFLDRQTVLYLVTDPDGSGPWMRSLDLSSKVGRRIGSGVDRYTSLSASADGYRIVATRASPKTTLWRVPLAGDRGEMAAATRIPLTTGSGTSPRLGPGYLLYLSSGGTGDGLWKLERATATELWSSPEARIVGAPAIERDARRFAFTVRRKGRTALMIINADGTGARGVGGTLAVQGTPAWGPDGKTLTVAAEVDGVPRLF